MSVSAQPHGVASAATVPVQLQRLPQVLARVAVSRSTWYNLIREGKAPAPINLGGSAVAWIEAEITAWIDSRIAATRGTATRAEARV